MSDYGIYFTLALAFAVLFGGNILIGLVLALIAGFGFFMLNCNVNNGCKFA